MLLVLQKLGENSVFDDVLQDVSSRCPSIDLPWLNTEIALASIQHTLENSAQMDEQPAVSGNKQRDKLTDDDTSELTAASHKQVTDYSHLYIYRRNASVTASQSQKTAQYIALSSSSSSSDEDENGSQLVTVADVDDALTASSVTVADTTLTTSIHSAKYSKFYRSPNTGIQIANPYKKRNKKQF